ncbi:heme-binding beta-barrel domain-containing protein [Thalassiella azotivora]
MPVEIPADTPAPLVPLAWLLGRWEGAGVVGYPTIEERRFGQEVEFRHDGRPFLHYRSQAWLLDDAGERVRPLASESGYWRVVVPEDPERAAREQAGVDLEVLLSHPTGIVEVYTGRASGGRVELSTDVVARTTTAKEYTAATRMYGQVEGDLLWVMDMAAVGEPMTAHASARLKRV